MKKVIALLALSVLFCMASCEEDGASDKTSSFKDTKGDTSGKTPSFKDTRDGKKYKTVKIGSQTWMAQNLDYHGEDGFLGLCYGDEPYNKIRNPKNCEKYGRLYDWGEAMKACPSGWHLPSDNEWQTLVDFAGGDEVAGKKLKAKSGWNDECKYEETNDRGKVTVINHCGTDDYGFSALPGGSDGRGFDDGLFSLVGNRGYWWSATSYEIYHVNAYYRFMTYSNDIVDRRSDYVGKHASGISFLFSVRCVQDFNQVTPESKPEDKTEEKVIKPAPAEDAAKTVAAGFESSGKIMYVNDVKGLNMRSEPSTDGVKLGTLFYGAKVQVLEKSSTPETIGGITDYWYKTNANAWVFGGFLSENPPQKGTLTDNRDRNVYRKVKIGKQTWMAENLNYATNGSKCYDNNPDNCAKYGRLYNWNEAIKACPKGWHLPSKAEWDAPVNLAGGDKVAGKKFKSKSGWSGKDDGTDEYGFSALPGGYGNPDGSFHYVGSVSDWWSASEINSENAYYRYLDYDYDTAHWGHFFKSNLYSVRCVQD